jgi:excisionase family DNA binding protein
MTSEKTILNKKEVAELLSISVRTVSRLMERGQIRYSKIGGSVRFASADVEALYQIIEYGCECSGDCGCSDFRDSIGR